MRKNAKLRLGSVLVVLMAFLAACGGGATAPSTPAGGGTSAPAADKTPIVIGWSNSLSGGTSDYGEASKNATEMALEDYKAKGGKYADRVKIVYYDDEAKPDKSVENINRLIQQDKAVILIGTTNSGNALGHIQIVQQSKIPEIISIATNTTITQKFAGEPKNYIFRTSMFDRNQVLTFVDTMVNNGFKKIAILHDTSGYGVGGKDDVVARLKELKITPIIIESFQTGDTDMTAQLRKAKDAGADALATYALAPELANVVKSADKIGWYPKVFGSWTLSQPLFMKLLGKDIANKFEIYMVQSFTIDQSPAAKEFHDKLMKKYGKDEFPIAAAQSYDSTMMALKALDKVGPDPEKLRDAIENQDDFVGVTSIGKKPYSKDNHEAIPREVMFLATYTKDGAIVKSNFK